MITTAPTATKKIHPLVSRAEVEKSVLEKAY